MLRLSQTSLVSDTLTHQESSPNQRGTRSGTYKGPRPRKLPSLSSSEGNTTPTCWAKGSPIWLAGERCQRVSGSLLQPSHPPTQAVEHAMWHMTSPNSFVGNDLAETLWTTTVSMMHCIACAKHKDGLEPCQLGHVTRQIMLLFAFLQLSR